MGHISRRDNRRAIERAEMDSQPLGAGQKLHRPARWLPSEQDDAVQDRARRQSADRSFASGIGLHTIDGIEAEGQPGAIMLQPGICILLLLEGGLDAALDGTSFTVKARRGPVGRVWSLARPARLVRTVARGRYTRQIVLTAPLSRFEDRSGERGRETMPVAFSRFLSGHLSMEEWDPSPTAICCAEALLARGPDEGMLGELAAERDSLSLMHDGLSRFRPTEIRAVPRHLRSRDLMRAQTAREMILRSLDDGLHLPEIAQRTGMSVSTLQRVFRDCFGQTVMEFARIRRLEYARDLLAQGGVSVGEAAGRAGYSSPANFATAFHREFGYPPSHVKERALRAALASVETA